MYGMVNEKNLIVDKLILYILFVVKFLILIVC